MTRHLWNTTSACRSELQGSSQRKTATPGHMPTVGADGDPGSYRPHLAKDEIGMTSVPETPGIRPEPSKPSLCPTCGTVEEWRPVADFEGIYEISTIGAVRSLPRRRSVGYGRSRVIPAALMTSRRISLRNGAGGLRYVLRSVLFIEHFSRAPLGATSTLKDGDFGHLCIGNLGWEFTHLPYRAAHRRVERLRGKAADHVCVDCGSAAEDWSYINSGYAEATSLTGAPYSLDPAEYDARCRSCHRRYDEAGVHRHRDASGRWTGVA